MGAIRKRFDALTFQRLVQLLCFLRNCSPTKILFHAFATGFAKSFAQLPILHQLIDARGKLSRELFGVLWFEWAFIHLLERDEKTSFTINNNLFNSAHAAGYNSSFACHCFKINDPEWFVDGRANEDRG